ncbi:MAG: polysaccharide ABC transporter ATP-binding protein [Gemmatimonadota bacterium]|nr:polysaccharide ABC transporter ATP-binding protein [Gemmatimonadota bacterium]
MGDLAIRVDGLGKRYCLAHLQQRHDTLRDVLAHAARDAARRVRRSLTQQRREENHFWALRDVSFEVTRGEVVGIIGTNGAGKSTLLKLLSRITEPTVGEAEVHGRVGSLLEVGTGFHGELTGRENVYLNGAILGMRRTEIARKFDEIVAFAEIEKFIDTPVKHYSSGMYLRLAFAVAAHLEPEILIVDEVLAVGDASFQKKCLGKMKDVAGAGRTVLFVSHNTDAVQRLCSRCLHLEQGTVAADGEVRDVVTGYLSSGHERPSPDRWIDLSSAARSGSGDARFLRACYTSAADILGGHPHPFAPLDFEFAISSDAERVVRSLAVYLTSQHGTKLINADTISQGKLLHLRNGLNLVQLRIAELCLNPGVYTVGLWLANSMHDAMDHLESAFEIEVVPSPEQGMGVTPSSNGVVATRFEVIQVSPDPVYSSMGS